MATTGWEDLSDREKYLTGLLVAMCLASDEGVIQVPTQLCRHAHNHTLHISVVGENAVAWVTETEGINQ